METADQHCLRALRIAAEVAKEYEEKRGLLANLSNS